MDSDKILNFDELIHHLGEFGTYQKRLYFIVILPAAFTCLMSLGTVFFVAKSDFRCAIPELENDTYTVQNDWHQELINVSVPTSNKAGRIYSQCTLYANRSSLYHQLVGNDTVEVVKCDRWVFDEAAQVGNTITTEFDLVCGNTIYQSHASMIYMVGILVGSFFIGILSDLMGRKIALCVSITVVFASNLALIFVPNFLAFTVLRFFTGVAAIGCWNTAFVIGLELVGPSKRVFTGIVIELVWCGAELALAGLAYWLNNWRYLQISFAVIYGLFLPYWYFVPESSRWLIASGKSERAREVITKVAKVNKVEVPQSLTIVTEADKPSIRKSLTTLVTRKRLLLRIFIILFAWFVCSMGYYGLTLNSGRIGGNIYVNYTVSVTMELIAYGLSLLLLDRIGRKGVFCTSIIAGGVACLATIFTVLYADKSLAWITLVLSMIGKLGVSSAFATVFVYTTELFPTNLRSFSLGVGNMFGKVGSSISPYIADLELLVSSKFGKSLPLMVFGIAMLVCGILTLVLPETLNTNLPDTVEEAENLQKVSTEKDDVIKLKTFKTSTYDNEPEDMKQPLK